MVDRPKRTRPEVTYAETEAIEAARASQRKQTSKKSKVKGNKSYKRNNNHRRRANVSSASDEDDESESDCDNKSDSPPQDSLFESSEEEEISRKNQGKVVSRPIPRSIARITSTRATKANVNYTERHESDFEDRDDSSASVESSADKSERIAIGRKATTKNKNAVKRDCKARKVVESEDDESSASEDDKEHIDYKIQHILGYQKLTQKEWREICDSMNTFEISRGSVMKQEDKDYFSDNKTPIPKYLVKWKHASYLHISWELEDDLLQLVGSTAKTHLSKFHLRMQSKMELFDDLRPGEYFPPIFLNVERVLDVNDDTVDPARIDFENAKLPSQEEGSASEGLQHELMQYEGGPANDENAGGAPQPLLLHGDECFLTVKWDSCPYAESTFEAVEDLRHYGIDYEQPLRDYYRREQIKPIPKSLTRRSNRLVDAEIIQQKEPPVFPGGELRDYQWEGVRWMLFNWSQSRNSILADEMGLGKTIQTAAFLHILKNHQKLRGPFLVVAPLSTIINWQRELSSWTNLDVVVYYGSQEDRQILRDFEFPYMSTTESANKGRASVSYKIEVIVTTPETCMIPDDQKKGNFRTLSSISWEVIVVDEAHKLKNYSSKLSATLRDEYSYMNCLLLTGTPLQNNVDELWTLLNFVDRNGFDDRQGFVNTFGELKEYEDLKALHARLKPYLLRREKENVEKSLPPKEEVIVEVELTVTQKQYYRAIYEQNTAFLNRGGGQQPSLVNLAMELRKCCNHTFLVKGAEVELMAHFQGEPAVDVMVKCGGKLVLLDKLLPKLRADGHKVLIFSQFRMMLDILEDYLHMRGYTYERIDGAIVGKKRQSAIDKFNKPEYNLFVMLLSTKAGGVGINLTAADTVVIYDGDWNPQNDIQAQARAHRIGQTKLVKVYRLLTRKTYEMHMFRTASLKLGLDYAVMYNLKKSSKSVMQDIVEKEGSSVGRVRGKDSGVDDDGDKEDVVDRVGDSEGTNGPANTNINLSKKELERLLKHGAYDIFREEKEGRAEEESRKFCDTDIDQILQRSAVIIHDKRSGDDVGAATASSFSTASFVAAGDTGAANDVAVDDPDFWSKVVGIASNPVVQPQPSQRRCRVTAPGAYNESLIAARAVHDSDEEFDPNDTGSEEAVDMEVDQVGQRKSNKGMASSKSRKFSTIKGFTGSYQTMHWDLAKYIAFIETIALFGYGNWEGIGSYLELTWTLVDVERACKDAMICYLFHTPNDKKGQWSFNSYASRVTEHAVYRKLFFFSNYTSFLELIVDEGTRSSSLTAEQFEAYQTYCKNAMTVIAALPSGHHLVPLTVDTFRGHDFRVSPGNEDLPYEHESSKATFRIKLNKSKEQAESDGAAVISFPKINYLTFGSKEDKTDRSIEKGAEYTSNLGNDQPIASNSILGSLRSSFDFFKSLDRYAGTTLETIAVNYPEFDLCFINPLLFQKYQSREGRKNRVLSLNDLYNATMCTYDITLDKVVSSAYTSSEGEHVAKRTRLKLLQIEWMTIIHAVVSTISKEGHNVVDTLRDFFSSCYSGGGLDNAPIYWWTPLADAVLVESLAKVGVLLHSTITKVISRRLAERGFSMPPSRNFPERPDLLRRAKTLSLALCGYNLDPIEDRFVKRVSHTIAEYGLPVFAAIRNEFSNRATL